MYHATTTKKRTKKKRGMKDVFDDLESEIRDQREKGGQKKKRKEFCRTKEKTMKPQRERRIERIPKSVKKGSE